MGNPGKENLDTGEPQPAASRLKIPAVIKGNKVACAEYRKIGKYLLSLGVVSLLDDMELAGLAYAYSEWVRLVARVAETGDLTAGGAPNPLVWMRDRAWESLHKILKEFGMTPASRSRIKANIVHTVIGKGMAERMAGELKLADVEKIEQEASTWIPPVEMTG